MYDASPTVKAGRRMCRATTQTNWRRDSNTASRDLREPLNKSRVAATEAFRDEMREATRRPWQAPRASGATMQIARKAPSLRVSAQWHSSALLRGLRIG